MESIYIKLKQDKNNISRKSLEEYKNTLRKNSIEYDIVREELENELCMKTIIHFDRLIFYKMQRYIIAQEMLEDFNLDEKGINNFLRLQKLLGDIEPKLKKSDFKI